MQNRPIRKALKITRKTFFDPKGWLDWNFLKTETTSLYGAARTTFEIPKEGQAETFDEAMIRLGLTDADVQRIYSRYRKFAFFFLFLSVILFMYGFFLLFSLGPFSGWILALAVCALFLSQAFRFDFWAFQIRNHKLGATIDEWKRFYLGESKSKGKSS